MTLDKIITQSNNKTLFTKKIYTINRFPVIKSILCELNRRPDFAHLELPSELIGIVTQYNAKSWYVNCEGELYIDFVGYSSDEKSMVLYFPNNDTAFSDLRCNSSVFGVLKSHPVTTLMAFMVAFNEIDAIQRPRLDYDLISEINNLIA